jgi:hypothetical protein
VAVGWHGRRGGIVAAGGGPGRRVAGAWEGYECRVHGPPTAAVLLGLVLALPAGAAAAPAISGADTDVWNARNPAPAYRITGRQGATMVWSVAGVGGGRGPSPLTVRLGRIPDARYALEARRLRAPLSETAVRRFRVDTTPPRIVVRVPGPAAEYAQGEVVAADFSCPGAVRCSGTVADGAPLPTARAGPASLTVTAADAAGNTATARAAFAVVAPPPQVIRIAPPAPDRPPETPPQTLNPGLLSPAPGARLATSGPVLSWRPRRGTRLYNLQVYAVEGPSVAKVISAFPRAARYRVPSRELEFGTRYVWRVWPYLATGYPPQPIGVSFFEVRRPVRLTAAQLLVNQRIAQTAVRRIDAVRAWLDAGLVAEDLRDGGLGREVFAPAITLTGGGVPIANGLAAPRPVTPALTPRDARRRPVGVSPRQLLINQRISQAAVRRAAALERRLEGGLSGGDLRDGAVTASKLAPGLAVVRARASVAEPPTVTAPAPAARRDASDVRLSAQQVLINQRISQAGVRRANALMELLEGGLTGAHFRAGSIGAAKLDAALRR